MRLGPGVGRVLLHPVVHHQVARDVPGGKAHLARAGEEDVGVVLADTLPVRDRLFRGPAGLGFTRCVFHLLANRSHQGVEFVEIALGVDLAHEGATALTAFGDLGLALIEPERRRPG